MSKYDIYYNGMVVEPPPCIKQIYSGTNLIWERAKKTGEIFIEKIFESAELINHVFSKNGFIVPEIVFGDVNIVYFDINGQQFATDFSDKLFIGQDDYSSDYHEYGEFVWAENPAYSIKTQLDSFDMSQFGPQPADLEYQPHDYIDMNNGSFYKRQISPAIADTIEQSARCSLDTYPTIISSEGGNGIYPLLRPYGDANGGSSILSYVRLGQLVTNSEYSILSVCDDRLICVENISIKRSGNSIQAYGVITERSLNGVFVRQLIEKTPIGFPYTPYDYGDNYTSKMRLVGDALLYEKRTFSSAAFVYPEAWADDRYNYMKSILGPYHVAYAGSDYFMFKNRDIGFFHTNSTESPLEYTELIDSETGEKYKQHLAKYSRDHGGAYYVDTQGALYTLAETSRKNDNGDTIYAVIRISRR